jgi:hypothetical protein
VDTGLQAMALHPAHNNHPSTMDGDNNEHLDFLSEE